MFAYCVCVCVVVVFSFSLPHTRLEFQLLSQAPKFCDSRHMSSYQAQSVNLTVDFLFWFFLLYLHIHFELCLGISVKRS